MQTSARGSQFSTVKLDTDGAGLRPVSDRAMNHERSAERRGCIL
jgi:hypothetical protein